MSDFYHKQTDAMRRVSKARENVAKKTPFFASILFGARLVESTKMKTFWTDGVNVYFNPDYVRDNDKYIEGNLLECTLHCAMSHLGRRKFREEKRWNQASDLSINPVVQHYFPLHPSAPIDAKFLNMSAERIYTLLDDEEKKQQSKSGGKGKSPPQSGKGPAQGGGSGDEETPGGMVEAENPEEAEQAAQEWDRRVKGALDKAGKGIGHLPADVKRLFEELNPADKLDWRDLIRDMARDAKSKTARTWARPNRRRLGGGDYMPGYGNDAVFRLVICFDTSGSVSNEMFKAMKNEVASALEQDFITHAHVVSVDTKIHDPTDISTMSELEAWTPRGGGGTDFQSAMQYVAGLPDVVGCLFLTDMETSSFGKEPPFPVVWVNWVPGSRAKAPFGRTVEYGATLP